MSRTIVAALADIHCGHKLGLLSPETELWQEDEFGNDELYKPEMTAVQNWLWRNYEKDRTELLEWAAGDRVILLFVGDATWGKKYQKGIITTRTADQIVMAIDIFEPWMDHISILRLAKGTPSHEFDEGTVPIVMANQLRAEYPKVDISVLSHGLATVDGVLIDYAHHGPSTGIRQWTKGNQLRYYLKSLMNQEIDMGNTPPRIVLRAHYHEAGWETDRIFGKRFWQSDILIIPAYCGITEFAKQVTKSTYMLACGIWGIEIIDGHVKEIRPFWRQIDTRRKEEL